jgi:hypothetical protein
VSVTGRVSPIRMPLLNTAVAIAIRAGNHSRTSDGKAGWLTATPNPIRNVAEKMTVVLGPKPRTAPNSATSPRPTMSALRKPSLAIRSEPGTAAVARSSTGRATRTPTAFSSRCRSWWMSGITGGTASMVTRRSIPPSQSSRSRNPSARVSLTEPS